MSADRLDVVIVAHDCSSAQVATTLASLRAMGRRFTGRAVVVGTELTADAAKGLETEHGVPVAPAQLTADGTLRPWAKADTPGHVAVLRAGDRIAPAGFAEIGADVEKGVAHQIYVLRPTENYVLDRQMSGRPSVSIERDQKLTWVGTTGFVLTSKVFARCRRYDLNSTLAMSGLFLEALLYAGRFRSAGRVVDCVAPLEDALTVEASLYDPEWYHGVNRMARALFDEAKKLHGEVPRYFQHAYLYLLHWRFVYNRNTANKMVLREDLPVFLQGVRDVLADVEDDALFSSSRVTRLDIHTKLYLLGLAGRESELSYAYFADDISVSVASKPIMSAASTPLDIELMEIADDGALHISGRYLFPLAAEGMRLVATYHGDTHECVATDRYTDSRAFGTRLYRTYAFEVVIPIAQAKRGSINFYLVSLDGESKVVLDPRFRRPAARLTLDKQSYWRHGTSIFYYRAGRIVVAPCGRRRQFQWERAYLRSLLAQRDKEATRAARLRLLYFLTRPYFRRKKIWLYFDKIYKAGDNGEYAFRHAIGRRDGISKYYVLRKDVPDAKRLKKAGVPFIRYNSLLHKLLVLNADIVFTTHINPHNFGGFVAPYEQFFRGLLTYHVVCIQHGLSVQDLSSTLNRVHDGTKRFCIASPVEYENLIQGSYGYGADELVPTGLARYDGLVSEDKREILIAPTWRNYLAAPYNMGRARGYSNAFRESAYYSLYTAIINDEKLLAHARATGYQIVLLLHPVTSSQIDDFPGNDVVDVVPSTGDFNYERALTRSSLMVTDYSGIQFDFAYMYKPVVYFHAPELPASYDEGSYEYETMALGEIHATVPALVDALCEYMDTGCALKDEYKKRIDDFFYFHDHDNAARIYEVGMQLQKPTQQ